MKYPQHIGEIYRRIEALEDAGYQELASTNDNMFLQEIEKELWSLEQQLRDECYKHELDTIGNGNPDRYENLRMQFR